MSLNTPASSLVRSVRRWAESCAPSRPDTRRPARAILRVQTVAEVSAYGRRLHAVLAGLCFYTHNLYMSKPENNVEFGMIHHDLANCPMIHTPALTRYVSFSHPTSTHGCPFNKHQKRLMSQMRTYSSNQSAQIFLHSPKDYCFYWTPTPIPLVQSPLGTIRSSSGTTLAEFTGSPSS